MLKAGYTAAGRSDGGNTSSNYLINVDTQRPRRFAVNYTQMQKFLQKEVRDAISKMRKYNAPGKNGIVTEQHSISWHNEAT